MDIKEAQLNSPELQTCTNIKTHSGSQNTNQSRKWKLVSTTKKTVRIMYQSERIKNQIYPLSRRTYAALVRNMEKSCPTTLTDHHQWCVRPFIMAGR